MLANFCQHLPINNPATWKPIHPSASSLPHTGVDLEENIQEMLNFQPLGLNLTQNLLHKRLMYKYKQWFSRKTGDLQPPDYRGWENMMPQGWGWGRERLPVTLQPTSQRTEGLPPGFKAMYVHKEPGQEGAWETGNRHHEEKYPQFKIMNTECSLVNEYAWYLKMTARIFVYFICLKINYSQTILVLENVITSFILIYSTHGKSVIMVIIHTYMSFTHSNSTRPQNHASR